VDPEKKAPDPMGHPGAHPSDVERVKDDDDFWAC
jgi:hypothetical protein